MTTDHSSDTNIDTFLFDIGNVLVTFDFNKAMRFVAANSDLDEAAVITAVNQLLVPLETGQIDGDTFLAELAGKVKYSGEIEALRVAYQDIFTLNPPMAATVESLAGDYRLLLFSNTSDLHKDWLFAHFAVFSHFDDGVFSFISGSMKPGDGMYRDAVQKFGVVPSKTIYLDDIAENVTTGIRHGFRGIRYAPDAHTAALAELARHGVAVS